MRAALLGLCLLLPTGLLACAGGDDDDDDDGESGVGEGEEGDGLTVEMDTSLGLVVMRLEGEKTPLSTDNFISYIDSGYYDGSDGAGATIFHRILSDFMVQGGIYDESGSEKSTSPAIALETDLGLSNVRGTLAMARTPDPDSATASFFINEVDNTFLDYQSEAEPGYAVFGEVTEGMDVVDAMAAVSVDGNGWPSDPPVVLSMTRY